MAPILEDVIQTKPSWVFIVAASFISDLCAPKGCKPNKPTCDVLIQNISKLHIAFEITILGKVDNNPELRWVFSTFHFLKIQEFDPLELPSSCTTKKYLDMPESEYWAAHFLQNQDKLGALNQFRLFLNSKMLLQSEQFFKDLEQELAVKLKKGLRETAIFEHYSCTNEDFLCFKSKTDWKNLGDKIKNSTWQIVKNMQKSKNPEPLGRIKKLSLSGLHFQIDPNNHCNPSFCPHSTDSYFYFTQNLKKNSEAFIKLADPILKRLGICAFFLIGNDVTNSHLRGPKLALVFRAENYYNKQTEAERIQDRTYNDYILAKLVSPQYDPTELLISFLVWHLTNSPISKRIKHDCELLKRDINRRLQEKVYVPSKNVYVRRKFLLFAKYKNAVSKWRNLANTCENILLEVFDKVEKPYSLLYMRIENFEIVDMQIKHLAKVLCRIVDGALGETKLVNFYLASKLWAIDIGKDKNLNQKFGYLNCHPDDTETEENLRKAFKSERYAVASPIFNFKTYWQDRVKLDINIRHGGKLVKIEFDTDLVLSELKSTAYFILSQKTCVSPDWKSTVDQYEKGANHIFSPRNNESVYIALGEKPFTPMYSIFAHLFFKCDGLKFTMADRLKLPCVNIDGRSIDSFTTWSLETARLAFRQYFGRICTQKQCVLRKNGNHFFVTRQKTRNYNIVPPQYLFWAYHIFFECCRACKQKPQERSTLFGSFC